MNIDWLDKHWGAGKKAFLKMELRIKASPYKMCLIIKWSWEEFSFWQTIFMLNDKVSCINYHHLLHMAWKSLVLWVIMSNEEIFSFFEEFFAQYHKTAFVWILASLSNFSSLICVLLSSDKNYDVSFQWFVQYQKWTGINIHLWIYMQKLALMQFVIL